MAQVPLAPQPVDDLAGRAAAGHVGDEVAEEAVDAGVLGGPGGRRPFQRVVIFGPQPAGQPLQARLDRPHALAFGGGLAQRFDQGRGRRGGKSRPAQELEDQADVADPDRRIGEPQRAEGPVGQPDDLGVGGRPPSPDELDADLGEFAVTSGRRRLKPEDRARHADAPGQGGALRGFGVGPHDAGGELGPQADLGRPPAGQLEQLGHDPRAALALVQLRELEDRRPHRLVARPPELVQQEPLERGEPGKIVGQPVSRAPHPSDRPLDRVHPDRPPRLRWAGIHDRCPSCARISRALCTESSSTDQERPLSSWRVARFRRLKTSRTASSGPTITASLWPRLEP